jgi:hypothetical protein
MKTELPQDAYKSGALGRSDDSYKSGRGAQFNTGNRFLANSLSREHIEGIDDWEDQGPPTQYIEQEAKSIVNFVDSPYIAMPATSTNTGDTAPALISKAGSW